MTEDGGSGEDRGSGDAGDPVAARLRAVVERQVSRRGITHLVLGVTGADADSRWIGAHGAARHDGTPMRADTPYFVASVTKLFVATLVLQLHEAGDVQLDESMAVYLDAELTTGLHHAGDVDLTPQITVHHLLGHTSGLPDYLEDRPRRERSWYTEIIQGHDRSWTLEDVVSRVRDELRPHFPPQDLTASGQRARYTDTGYQLLIAIIESVTGRAFHEQLERRILAPLGMRSTWLPDRSLPTEEVAEPAELFDRNRALDVPGVVTSSNDLMGTAGDMLTFMRGLTRGELFEDPGTYELMQQRFNRIMYPLRYGIGLMRFRISKVLAPGRQPLTLVGHTGATGSWLFHCPELDVYLAGTVDQVTARAYPFRFAPQVLRAYVG